MKRCEQQWDEQDARIWAKIYEQYDDYIQSVLRFIVRNREDREDLYQEILVVLFLKDDWHEVKNIKRYLYRIIVNKANAFFREKIAQEHKLKEYIEDVKLPRAADSEEELIREQMDKATEFLQKHLTRRESEAILLRFKYYGCDGIEKGANKMKIKRKTLIQYVSIGLKKLRSIQKKGKKSQEGDDYEL